MALSADADYVMLADPDGNTFCVIEKPLAAPVRSSDRPNRLSRG
jgi:hypothetical protein